MKSLRGGVEEMILGMLPIHYRLVCRSVCKYWHEVIGGSGMSGLNFSKELARNGHLHLLQWVRSNGCPWDKDECLESGYKNIVEWIKTQ